MRIFLLLVLIFTTKTATSQETKFIANWPLMSCVSFENNGDKFHLVYSDSATYDFSLLLKLNQNGEFLNALKFSSESQSGILNGLKQLENGNFLLAGTINQNGFISLTDSLFQPIWVKSMSGTQANLESKIVPDEILTADSIIYLIGEEVISPNSRFPLISAFDENGNELWTKRFNCGGLPINIISTVTSNDNIVLSFSIYSAVPNNSYEYSVYLIKLNSTGDLVYSKRLKELSSFFQFTSIDVLTKENGNVLLGCVWFFESIEGFVNIPFSIFLEFSPQGEIIDSLKGVFGSFLGPVYNDIFFSHFVKQDTSNLLVHASGNTNGNLNFHEFNDSFNNLDTINSFRGYNELSYNDLNNEPQKIKKSTDYYIQPCNIRCSNNRFIALSIFDTLFNASSCIPESSNRVYGESLTTLETIDTSCFEQANFIFTNPDNFIFEPFDTPQFVDFCGDCSILNVSAAEQQKLLIFPNPSAGIFTLQLETGFSNKTIKVMDVLGRNVYQKQIAASENKSDLIVDLTNLTTGIYMVTVVNLSTGCKQTEKIIIQ